MKGLKKKLCLSFCIVIGIIGIILTVDKVIANRGIEPAWIKEFNESKDKESERNILEMTLEDTGYIAWKDKLEQIGLKINTADLLGDTQKELILTISLAPKKTIIAVYQRENKLYKYVGMIDTFFDVAGLQTIPLDKKQKDIVIIREYVDQMLGAFEKGIYLRGYVWNNGKFEMVLSIIEDYQGYWNEMWDQPSKTNPKWLRIAEKTNIQWENGPYPVLRVLEHQSYSKSKISNSTTMPKEDDYEVVTSKDVPQTYYWNEKYQHFILNEGKDIKTGENIAIIEDLSLNPFELAGFELNQYRIKRQDGKIEIVPKNQITNIKTPLRKSEGFHK